MSQLTADCLNKILEYLKDDMFTLHSCLLVNRLWCEVSVRFFWRNNYDHSTSNFVTLIACLPVESKEILSKNGIIISIPTSKLPIFNYASFCKVLLVDQVYYKLKQILKNQKSISSQNLSNNMYILTKEIFKLYMSQIGSLKELIFQEYLDTNFYSYPEAKDCLKNLSKLTCSSNISSEFFYQLSQICHNISSLDLSVEKVISNGLTDLISVQKNLKYLNINHYTNGDLKDIISSLANPNKINKLVLYTLQHTLLSFITKFTDLQELGLFLNYYRCFKDFEKLQYAIFPKLQILKIRSASSKYELLIKFLENNGDNLKECHIDNYRNRNRNSNSLNLAIAKFCPNLQKLSTGFKSSELETLKIVYNSCQYLESINIWCGGEYLSEKEALEAFVKYSHKNVYEIILYHVYSTRSKLLPEELESFFISWTNRVPQKLLSLIIINNYNNSLDINAENMKIINKYINLGVIKKFKKIIL
ncbi:hypothetical protein C1645_827388 [Glomus cerebriforme]|uniref:F-box domain-containing protein n=1 Tax=Glomus cerebriforme TaxID=658196 RepID=A0A397SSZ1_9GLOM|nr:hypothetical protein C1645_827388 [Glomus cerebriforme]